MKKNLFILLFIFVISISRSQISFSHSVGLSFIMPTNQDLVDIGGLGVEYSPRLNVLEVGDNSTVSVGTHLLLGGSGGDSRSGFDFYYSLPLVAEYNFGSASNRDNMDNFGFYVGGGYGIFSQTVLSSSINAPVLTGGVRFIFRENIIDINVSYMPSTYKYKVAGESFSIDQSLVNIGIQYVIGGM